MLHSAIFKATILVACVVSLCQGTILRSEDVSSMALHYYKARDVKWLNVFCCWPPAEKHRFFQMLNHAGMAVRFIGQKEESIDEADISKTSKGGMLIDATCKAVLSDLWKMGTALNKLLLGNIFWLFVEEANGTEPITISDNGKEISPSHLQTLYSERLRTLQVLPYTNIAIGSRNERRYWQLFEVFKFPSQSLLVMEEIAVNLQPVESTEETLRTGLERLRKQNHRRRNMNGFQMSCASAVTAPEYYKGPDDTTDTIHDVYMRSNFPIIQGLMYEMNFTLNLMQVDSGGWKKNGTFTSGLFGKFQNHSIELGCTGALMRAERLEVVDFLAGTLLIKSNIVFRQPPLSIVANIFKLPFSVGVWLSCLLMVIIYWVSMIVIRTFTTVESFTAVDSLIYIIGTMFQRGYELVPHCNGTRLLMFSIQITSFFIVTSYSASIVALLQSPSLAITSIKDLTQSPLRAAVMDNTYSRMYYREAQDPEVRELYLKKIKPLGEKGFIEADEGIARVKNGLFAFEVEENAAYRLIKETFEPHDICKLKELKAIRLPVFGIPIVKGSKYREIFRQRILWQQEVGLINRLHIFWIQRKPKCEYSGTVYTSVGLVEMRYLYIFLVVGFIVALLVLMTERTWHGFVVRVT